MIISHAYSGDFGCLNPPLLSKLLLKERGVFLLPLWYNVYCYFVMNPPPKFVLCTCLIIILLTLSSIILTIN